MTDIFLTYDEIADLTGYVQPSAQRRWLQRNGYRFDVRGDGRPVVLRAQVDQRQRIREVRTSGPDLAALDSVR